MPLAPKETSPPRRMQSRVHEFTRLVPSRDSDDSDDEEPTTVPSIAIGVVLVTAIPPSESASSMRSLTAQRTGASALSFAATARYDDDEASEASGVSGSEAESDARDADQDEEERSARRKRKYGMQLSEDARMQRTEQKRGRKSRNGYESDDGFIDDGSGSGSGSGSDEASPDDEWSSESSE